MDEQRLHDILKQDLEVPKVVNDQLKRAYAQLEGRGRPAKRRGLGTVRMVLIAAAAVAVLCATATAAWGIFRRDVVLDKPQLVQGILGGGGTSWERTENYDEMGRLSYWPKREMVPVDEELAIKLLGDYLPQSGYQWKIDDYTFTVEGYVLDEHTGTGRVYYTIEHPGGFGEGAVDWEHGVPDYTKFPLGIVIETLSNTKWPQMGGRQYVDVNRSTEEKLVIVESLACPLAISEAGWKAADGLRIGFYYDEIWGDKDSSRQRVALEVPGVDSLPAVTVTNPETGELAAAFSAIGMVVDTRYLTTYLPDGYEVHDSIGYLALEYTDGTSYVVIDSGLDNADYACSDEHSTQTHFCFNRLVDPSQVTAVIVDGQRYAVG